MKEFAKFAFGLVLVLSCLLVFVVFGEKKDAPSKPESVMSFDCVQPSAAPVLDMQLENLVTAPDSVSEGGQLLADNLSVTCEGCANCMTTNGIYGTSDDGLTPREARTFAPPDVGGQSLLKTSPNACHNGRLQRNRVLLTYKAGV